MTYGKFHLVFNLPLLGLLAVLARVWERGWEWWWPMGAVLGMVYLFTIPWDNYAAWRGIWGFPTDRYSRRIGWLPVEEYLFFGLQSVQAMLLTQWLLGWLPTGEVGAARLEPSLWVGLCIGAVVITAIGWSGRRIGVRSRWHYAWHLLFWFLPVFGGLAWLGWGILGPLAAVWLATTLLLGTYLTLADVYAIKQGIWHFDEAQITGWRLRGVLPWEEAAFFYLTSALVGWSYLLLLPEGVRG